MRLRILLLEPMGWGALILIVGLTAPSWLIYPLSVAATYGIVGLGLVLIIRAGDLSFGQGLFFAIGGYATAIARPILGDLDGAFLILIAILLGLGSALIIGVLLSYFREMFYAILSLGFSMVFYGILITIQTLGGSDGMTVSRPVRLLGFTSENNTYFYYYLSCAIALIVGITINSFLKTRLGIVINAIGSNAIRARYLGCWESLGRLIPFVIAGGLGGLGGALEGLISGHVGPDYTHWTTSGEFVFIAILAGRRGVRSVFVAAVILTLLRNLISDSFPYYWEGINGMIILLMLLFMKNGLSDAARQIKQVWAPTIRGPK